ncbi:S8 family serine peptidase [Streptomyces sp. XD-27]|nr:S8 family serine peptidase [Streptomyces sp. XD-27]WKX74255.1 S8 family serine peptidase [Streptomyces sp. XD-27]
MTAGLTTAPAAAAQDRGGAPAADGTRGAAAQWVTLLTGDRIAVDTAGRPTALKRAEGREDIPIQIRKADGHTYAVPLDAQRLVSQGRLDQRLFDLTTLTRPDYLARQRDGLRLIVTYQGDRPAARSALRAAGGTEVRRTFRTLNADAVTTPRQDAAAAWDALTDGPTGGGGPFRTAASGIAAVWLDGIRTADLDKSVPQIGAPEAWRAGYDGKGVKIAVLDTGVDQTHPDLARQEIAEKNFSDAADAKDRFGHGTHVASIAAGTGAKSGGKYKGVAPGAKILDGKVLDDSGSGGDSGILAGMEWAAAEKADVVNLSLGGPDSPGDDPLEAAVDTLSARTGTLFVISAGNDGPGAGTIGSPGSARAALTVGAVDKKDKLADFSSTGPRVGDGAVKPDVTAPGVDIGAAAAPGSVIAGEGTPVADGYVAISGTSMAAPHTAGAAALLAQQHPDWPGDRIKAALTGSTTPGKGYSAFQQGSGRIDLRTAIKQSVVADQVSLSFGTQAWPHADDKPVSKELTYRNLGNEPVTLDLAVTATGPDGKPAPGGFFTLKDKRLTVPANGTAATSVTTDTRLGGALDGAYSAYVTATGGGQSVRTAAAVEREVESYDLTLRHLGRDGRPAKFFQSTVQGVSGLAEGRYETFDGTTGAAKVRIPKGRYVLSGSVLVSGGEEFKGADWINQPRLDLTRNTTVTVDARTAKPVEITVPDARATSEFATIDMTVRTGGDTTGYGWWLDSYKNFRTAHLGPASAPGELTQQVTNSFKRGNGPEYHLAYGGKVTRLATGFVRHAKSRDLAEVTAELGAPAPGKTGYLAAYPETGSGGGAAVSFERKLPHTSRLFVNGGGVTWRLSFDQVGTQGETDSTYTVRERAYRPGSAYALRFNVGVFGPALGSGQGVFREGNEISGELPLFADGSGHDGWSAYDKAVTTLYRDGEKVGTSDDPLSGGAVFTVPAGRADYRLTTSVTRGTKTAKVSTKVTAAWTFSSQRVAGRTGLPASVVRFTPRLAADSTAKAGATVAVPVAVRGAAAGRNLKSLTVHVSYDDGAHWKKLTVTGGKVTVKNPAAGKSVSFKAKAVDKQGNTVSQAILRAYLAT